MCLRTNMLFDIIKNSRLRSYFDLSIIALISKYDKNLISNCKMNKDSRSEIFRFKWSEFGNVISFKTNKTFNSNQYAMEFRNDPFLNLRN